MYESTNINYGKIIRKDCTKTDAIKKDSIAFGDSMNNYQMIKITGYGVVLHLAFDKLKTIADSTFDKPDMMGFI